MSWTRESLVSARKQGWTIFRHGDTQDLVIAKVDDVCEEGEVVCFEYDDDALAFVIEQAAKGDALAHAALDYVD